MPLAMDDPTPNPNLAVGRGIKQPKDEMDSSLIEGFLLFYQIAMEDKENRRVGEHAVLKGGARRRDRQKKRELGPPNINADR